MKKRNIAIFFFLLFFGLQILTACGKDDLLPANEGDFSQILELYNEHTDPVKSAANITVTKRDKRETEMDIPLLLKLLAQGQLEKQLNEQLGGDPNKDATVTETFIAGKGAQDEALTLIDFLPVGGQNYMSRLKGDNIASAVFTERENGENIKIRVKDEAFTMENKASVYPSFMDVGFGAENSSGNENEGGFSGIITIAGTFKDGGINALFDKDWRLISLTLTCKTSLEITVIGMKIEVEQSASQEFQFTWEE